MSRTQPSFGSILAAAALWLAASTGVATAQAEPDRAILDRVLELEVELKELNDKLDETQNLLAASVEPWRVVAPNIRAFNDWMQSDNRLLNYEFGIMRNRGFRKLTVSSWNGGHRFVTDSYLRGDTATTFALGASFWVIGTNEPSEGQCTGSEARHYYLRDTGGGMTIDQSNECSVDGPIYARKRLFEADLP